MGSEEQTHARRYPRRTLIGIASVAVLTLTITGTACGSRQPNADNQAQSAQSPAQSSSDQAPTQEAGASAATPTPTEATPTTPACEDGSPTPIGTCLYPASVQWLPDLLPDPRERVRSTGTSEQPHEDARPGARSGRIPTAPSQPRPHDRHYHGQQQPWAAAEHRPDALVRKRLLPAQLLGRLTRTREGARSRLPATAGRWNVGGRRQRTVLNDPRTHVTYEAGTPPRVPASRILNRHAPQ